MHGAPTLSVATRYPLGRVKMAKPKREPLPHGDVKAGKKRSFLKRESISGIDREEDRRDLVRLMSHGENQELSLRDFCMDTNW